MHPTTLSNFTSIKPYDDSVAAILASAWNKDTPLVSRERICFDPDMVAGFIFVDPTMTARFIAVPKQVGHDPTPPIVGNMGNDLTHISPCSITVWTTSFIGLVTTTDSTNFNLQTGSNCPSLTTAPVTPDDPTPGYAQHAPFQFPGDAFQFSLLPLFLPVPYGLPIPLGNFHDDTITNAYTDTTYPFGRVWLNSMSHIHSTNAGKPFHIHNGLFQADTVIGTTEAGTLDFADAQLLAQLSPPVSILQMWDPLYKVAFDHCTKFHQVVLPSFPDQPTSPAPATHPTTSDSDLVSILVKALSKNIADSSSNPDTPRATLTEQGKKAEAAIAQLKYRLILSYITEDGTVMHPVLNPAFTECILASSSHSATRMFVENLADFTREYQTPTISSEGPTNPLWPYANLDLTYDKFLATVILNADWFQGHPDTDKMGPQKAASIFAFCAPDTASIEFQLRTANGLTDNAEHVAGEHAAKRQKTTTDILLVNKQHEQADPLSCVANTFSIFRFMVTQQDSDSCPTTPVIIRILIAFGNLFREPQFVRWVNFYLPAYPWLPHCLIMEIHSSLRPILQLLSYQGYRKAVADNNPIDPKVFQDPWDSASATINRLRGCIFANKLGEYNLRPTSYGSTVCPLPKKVRNDPAPPTTTTKHPPTKRVGTTEKPKSSTPTPTPNNRTNNQSSPGLLAFTRDGNPPPHCKTIFAKLPNGNLARLCSNFLIQGIQCKNGTTCPFVHLSNLNELDQANRTIFNKWVRDTPNINFPSQSPPSGNTPPPVTITP
jgi:hypothetical protein